MKLSHTKLITISGLIWFGIGIYLLQLGLGLLLGATQVDVSQQHSLLNMLSPLMGTVHLSVIFLIALGLFIGYFKGRFVLGKSAQKGVVRILSFPNPTHLSNIYSAKYYILLAAMMGIGISIKYLGINNDLRGFIDVIIGSALINGAIIYFRLAQSIKA